MTADLILVARPREAGGLPVPVTASFALHVAGLFLWLQYVSSSKSDPLKVISDVDLIVQARRPVSVDAPPPPTTWNFLKLALPKAAPKLLDTGLESKVRKPVLAEPEKLEEAKNPLLKKGAVESLDLAQRRQALSEVADMAPKVAKAAPQLAAPIDLEEVGTRRAPNLPKDIRFDESQAPVRPQSVQDVASAIESARRAQAAVVAAPLAPEAQSPLARRVETSAPSAPPSLDITPRDLPEGRDRPLPTRLDSVLSPSLSRRGEALTEPGKKAVEIEGPLQNRKVVSYALPPFPDWAREQGILEAAVAIHFYVGRDGKVLAQMRVERTSGYGAMDRLAMEALKKWVFASLPEGRGAEKEWGIITFRFILE